MVRQRGFSLIEVLIVIVVLGFGLGGLLRLLGATLDQEGQVRQRMDARWLALSALEQGSALPVKGRLRVVYQCRHGRREARVVWREGERERVLGLQGGYGRD
jgi:prepilin-type N-terminal cleavage/methylation domain-containing protein